MCGGSSNILLVEVENMQNYQNIFSLMILKHTTRYEPRVSLNDQQLDPPSVVEGPSPEQRDNASSLFVHQRAPLCVCVYCVYVGGCGVK